MIRYRRHCRGFTLLELIVIIVAVTLLMVVLLVVLGNSHEQARRTSCQHNLSAIGYAFYMYADSNAGKDSRGAPIIDDITADDNATNTLTADGYLQS